MNFEEVGDWNTRLESSQQKFVCEISTKNYKFPLFILSNFLSHPLKKRIKKREKKFLIYEFPF